MVAAILGLAAYIRWQDSRLITLNERLLQYLEDDGGRREAAIASQLRIADGLAAVGASVERLTTAEYQEKEIMVTLLAQVEKLRPGNQALEAG